MGKLDWEQLSVILESAILAPSADNQHRIRFELAGDIIKIRSREAKLPHPHGYKWVLALLSLGAVSENLKIAAARFGIKAETVLLPDPTQPDLILQVFLQRDQAIVDPLWQVIPCRHTNRRPRFRGPAMTASELSELDTAAHSYPACQLVWLDQSAQRRQAIRLMRLAETERFRNRLLHEELFSAIRFEMGWRTECVEGLPPGALEVEPPLRPFFALLRHWQVMRFVNLLGAHYMLGFRSCDLPCRLAPHLGLLGVKNFDTQSVFDVGRSFQRLWLAATAQDRVLQPMPASALYALSMVPDEGIPVALQQELAQGWKVSLHDVIPLMLFRMGKAKPSSIVAQRRELGAYLNL